MTDILTRWISRFMAHLAHGTTRKYPFFIQNYLSSVLEHSSWSIAHNSLLLFKSSHDEMKLTTFVIYRGKLKGNNVLRKRLMSSSQFADTDHYGKLRTICNRYTLRSLSLCYSKFPEPSQMFTLHALENVWYLLWTNIYMRYNTVEISVNLQILQLWTILIKQELFYYLKVPTV